VLIPAAAEMAAPSPVSAGPGQWVPFLLATWAGGAVIFLILQWLGYRAFLRRLNGTARPARPPRYGGIATFVSRMVEGPLALGLIEPRIVIPADFSRRYSPGERRLAMEHELTHHRHRDIWWNMAATAFLAVNWFNPLAWLAYRAFRADQELACDAAVAAQATIEERCDYARALVKSATGPRLIAACPINGAGTLKRRLRMLRGHRASPARSAGGLAALTVLALAGATSAALRTAPAQMPQLVAASVAARPGAIWAPVRLAAAVPVPKPVRAAVAVTHSRHATPVRLADAPPRLDLPPFAAQPQPAEAASEPSEVTLASATTAPETPEADAAPAPQLMPAVAFRVTESPLQTADGPKGRKMVLYRLSEAAAHRLIETQVRKAVAEARRVQARGHKSIRLAQIFQVTGGGTWTSLNFQIVEQGD
jgi:hypothetical protein